MNKRLNNWRVISKITALVIILTLIFAAVPAYAQNGSSWTNWGGNLQNTRFQAAERTISAQNVGQLGVKWIFTTAGDVSATASVADGAVYFPDWAGLLYKVNAETGALIWSKTIAEYTGIAGSYSRTTPAIDGGFLYLGSQDGAYLLKVEAATGNLVWARQLDEHPAAQITQSPTVYNGKVLVGVSSGEEGLATDPTYACCTFRGSMTAVDASTGSILWKTYIIPDNGGLPGGFSGGAVWGSSPSVDGNSVFIATGNNYDVPQTVKDCQSGGGTDCVPADDYIDSIMSLNVNTGAINWATRVLAYDAWTVACIGVPGPNCPTPAGPDYDFGQAPMLFSARVKGKTMNLVGVGQKSGVFWALNRSTGKILWGSTGGPGSTLGGMQWGSATDGRYIYFQIGNNNHETYMLKDGTTTDGGLWGAMDPSSGKIKWQFADPTGEIDTGPLSVANGVVFGGSISGDMYGFNTLTGEVLWNFHTAGSVNSGPAIVDGVLYWGTGYSHIGGTPGNQFYAFALP